MIELNKRVDLDIHAQARSSMDVRLWTRESLVTSPEDQAIYFDDLPAGALFYGLWVDGHFVGCAGLTSINKMHRTAEFSLYVHKKHRGKGYGSVALKKLCNLGFDVLNLNRIYGETFCYPKEAKDLLTSHHQKLIPLNQQYKKIQKGGDYFINPACIVFDQLGFEFEGFLKERYYKFGHYVNTVIVSVGREQWKHSHFLF